jgi:hypothetical protein
LNATLQNDGSFMTIGISTSRLAGHAPRNDRVGVMAPGCVIEPGSVIARNEAIHRRSHIDMDCHGAARLALTEAVYRPPGKTIDRFSLRPILG